MPFAKRTRQQAPKAARPDQGSRTGCGGNRGNRRGAPAIPEAPLEPPTRLPPSATALRPLPSASKALRLHAAPSRTRLHAARGRPILARIHTGDFFFFPRLSLSVHSCGVRRAAERDPTPTHPPTHAHTPRGPHSEAYSVPARLWTPRLYRRFSRC